MPSQELLQLVRRHRRRFITLRATEWLAWLVAVSTLLLAGSLLADRYWILSGTARATLSALVLGVPILLSATFVAALACRPSLSRVARIIERAEPTLHGCLLSSVELAVPGKSEQARFSQDLLTSLQQSTLNRLTRIDPRRVFNSQGATRALAMAILTGSVLLAGILTNPRGSLLLLARLAHPLTDLPRPTTVELEVSPGSVSLARGSNLTILARTVRGTPDSIRLWTQSIDAPWTLTGESRSSPELLHTLNAVRRDLKYRVTAKDWATPGFTVRVREPPRLRNFTVTYTFPGYTGRVPEVVQQSSGDLVAIAGTQATLVLDAGEPLRHALMVFDDGSSGPPGSIEGDKATFRGIKVTTPESYRLTIELTDGVRSAGREDFTIRPLADRPPTVDLIEPRGAELNAEASSVVTLLFHARDDVAVKSLEVHVKAEAGTESSIALDPTTTAYRLQMASLGLRPGESTRLCLRAHDGLGQEGRSSERIVRVALVPDPPEGPLWPRPLAEIESSLHAVLEDWARMLPESRGETLADVTADLAFGERLASAAEKTLAILGFLGGTASLAVETGRAISVPSPNRRALEGLAHSITEAANEECAAFWAEASLVAGKIQEAGRDPGRRIPVSKLHAAHRAAGARLEEALSSIRSLLRPEELEELLEQSTAIEHDLALAPARAPALKSDVTRLAAGLTRLVGRGGEDFEAASRSLLEVAAPSLELTPGVAAQSVAIVRANLQSLHDRDERVAAQVRARLGRPMDAQADLDRFAAATEKSEALTRGRKALLSLTEELERAQAMDHADLETSADLSTIRELIDLLLKERLELGSGQDSSLAEDARNLAALYRTSAGSRALGRIIQGVDRLSLGEENLAWRVRGSSSWNWRNLRQIARSQRECQRTLVAHRSELTEARQAIPGAPSALAEGLAQVDADLEAASKAMVESHEMPGGNTSGESSRDETILAAAQAMGRAASLLSGVTERLESLRSLASPGASGLRDRLKARLGTLEERITRLATAERLCSERMRDLSRDPEALDFITRTELLQVFQEELRSETEALATNVRKEGDRVAAERGGLARLRVYDRSAVGMAEIATDEVPRVIRALRSVGTQSPSSRGGTLFAAAAQGFAIAERLGQIARALSASESAEALQLSSQDLQTALKSLEPGSKAGEKPQDPARVERDAGICLAAALKAAQSLARQAAQDPRKQPLLDLLRDAAELFRQAITLAQAGDPACGGFLEAGRARLEEAVTLAQQLRGEAQEEASEVQRNLGEDTTAEAGASGKERELTRELEAAYAELEKLLEHEKLKREIAAQLEDLLRDTASDPKTIGDLEKKEQELEEELRGRYLTTAELVELVSKLVSIDRDGREISTLERTLAAEAAALFLQVSPTQAKRKDLETRQIAALGMAQKVAKEFHESGLKLSAVLPHVLRAYWRAGEATGPALQSMEAAARALETGAEAPGALLAAAARMEDLLTGVGNMRRAALEAIADQERGDGGPNAAQSSLERARQLLDEASRLRQEGQVEASQRARKQSLRSIADASGAIRSRVAELSLPVGGEARLMSRVLDEEAARLGLGWQVSTRGSGIPNAARLTRENVADMPYPGQFRSWVKVYLMALDEGRP